MLQHEVLAYRQASPTDLAAGKGGEILRRQRWLCQGLLVHPARLELPLLDPKLGRNLGSVAANLVHKSLRVLAADEHLKLNAEGEVGERASSTTA